MYSANIKENRFHAKCSLGTEKIKVKWFVIDIGARYSAIDNVLTEE